MDDGRSMTRRRPRAGLLCVLTILGACGSRAAPAATVAAPEVTSSAPTVRCPASPVSIVATTPLADEDAAAMNADSAIVDMYGRAHAEEFSGVAWSDGHLRAWFTAHGPEHSAALRSLMVRPDRLEVVLARHSLDELQAVRDEITVAHTANPDLPVANGVGIDSVLIMLAPGQESAADRLIDRYGDALDIEIGGRRYVPTGCGEPTPPDICEPLIGVDPAGAGLQLTLVADTPTIRQSEVGRAHLVIKNVGTTRFSIDPGQPMLASIVAPATTRVIGHDTFIIAGTGLLVDLEPGEDGTVRVEFGAGRCDGGPGSAVPAGTYGLRVVLTPEGASTGSAAYLSPEIPISVTP